MKKQNLKIGQPFEPMLVSEAGSSDKKFDEIIRLHEGNTLAEIKYDGYRIQLHKSDGLWLFTRNLNEIKTELFPELERDFAGLPEGIFDGELVGLEDGIKGFNSVKKRIRTELDTDLVEKYPLQIRFFDILLLENKEILNLPLLERRKNLENYIENVSEQFEFDNSEELKEKFCSVTAQGIEGLVCKNPSSEYQLGKRTKDWIKLKKFMTLDLAVLGVYKGEGKAAGLPFAAVLLGAKNGNYYETISKVGIFDKKLIDSVHGRIESYLTGKAPKNIVLSKELNKKTYSGKVPFAYISPENSVVLEVEALNITHSKNWHSCGLDSGLAYSLRIPVIRRLREDKKVEDCNTTSQINEIYHK